MKLKDEWEFLVQPRKGFLPRQLLHFFLIKYMYEINKCHVILKKVSHMASKSSCFTLELNDQHQCTIHFDLCIVKYRHTKNLVAFMLFACPAARMNILEFLLCNLSRSLVIYLAYGSLIFFHPLGVQSMKSYANGVEHWNNGWSGLLSCHRKSSSYEVWYSYARILLYTYIHSARMPFPAVKVFRMIILTWDWNCTNVKANGWSKRAFTEEGPAMPPTYITHCFEGQHSSLVPADAGSNSPQIVQLPSDPSLSQTSSQERPVCSRLSLLKAHQPKV